MKRVFFLATLFCLSTIAAFPQKSKTPVKSNASKQTPAQPLKVIPDADWRVLIDAVEAESWEKSATLAARYLTKIKIENDKKQLARLRYILLYAMAGKIVSASFAGKKPEENKARVELKNAADGFLEKEFFMPSREISGDCEGKLNFICGSKQQKNVLRVTATNRAGTAIYSFDYIRLKENFRLTENIGKHAVIGGVMKKIEFNPNESNVWIMRLFFENGSVNIVPEQ
jgi:hypothetical protein